MDAAGSFALWGMFYSGYDCSLLGIREKDDIWNSITAGALTGACLLAHDGKPCLRVRLVCPPCACTRAHPRPTHC